MALFEIRIRGASKNPASRRAPPTIKACIGGHPPETQNPIVTSTVNRVRWPDRRGHRGEPLPEVMEQHAGCHCSDEDDHARRQRRETLQRRPRAEADKAPADPEQG